ncbi:MAG: hypothetical protein Q8O32_01690 [bacterium]|nr:hypothetical protein [bacterium]
MDNIQFARNLVKGKIAETIFEGKKIRRIWDEKVNSILESAGIDIIHVKHNKTELENFISSEIIPRLIK